MALGGLLGALATVAKVATAKAPKPTTTTDKNPTTGSGSSGSGGSKNTGTTTTVSSAQKTQAEATIAQAQAEYKRANAIGDYAGMRAANEKANAARQLIGAATVDSSVGDAQRAASMGNAGGMYKQFAPVLPDQYPLMNPLEGYEIFGSRANPQAVLNTANSVLDRYTVDQLVQLFGPGVEASYNTLEQDAKRTLGAFDQGIFQIGNNNIEAVKRMQGTAATGQASQAVAGAQGLSALMNTFMDAAPVFTGMNQELQGLSGKKAEAMANLVPTAIQAKNTQDSNFANLFNSLYAADTQFGVGALDYLGNKYNADQNVASNKYAADKNLEGTIQQALASVKASKNYSSGGGGGGSTYNPNATYESYVTKAYDALANGNKGDFYFYMTQVGVEPKEANDLYDIWYKEQKSKTGEEQKKPPQSAIDFFQKRLFDKDKPYNSGFTPTPYNVLNNNS